MNTVFQRNLLIRKPVISRRNFGKEALSFQEIRVVINPQNVEKFNTWWKKVKDWEAFSGIKGVAREEISNPASLNRLLDNNSLNEIGSTRQIRRYIVDFSDYFQYPQNFFGWENKKEMPTNFDEVFDSFKSFWVGNIESFVQSVCSVEKAQEILQSQFGKQLENKEKIQESKTKKTFGGFQ